MRGKQGEKTSIDKINLHKLQKKKWRLTLVINDENRIKKIL